MADLADGRGAIVAITGEPGIGKSRLIAEVRRRAEDRVRFFGRRASRTRRTFPTTRCASCCARASASAWRSRGPRAARAEDAARGRARRAGGCVTTRFSRRCSGSTLEEDAAQRLQALARDSVQRQSHEAVAELVRALARERPVCLVLEDLHFADEPTLELFEELLQLAEEEPVALLLAYRHDPDLRSWELGEAARRRYRHRFRELLLEPLDASSAARARGRGGRDAIFPTTSQRSSPNERAAIRSSSRRRRATRSSEATARPCPPRSRRRCRRGSTGSHRTSATSPRSRRSSAAASACRCSERLVPPERLRPALSELQRLDLVVEERRRPTPEYRFRHGLVREAAYSSLLDQRRRDLHRVVGTTLEELDEDELSEAYGLLAHHFAEADEPERAARYLLEAGDAARAVYADEEAIAHYRRALSFLDRLGDARRARQVLFKIALAHHLAFDFEAANAAWAEAFTRPGRHLDASSRPSARDDPAPAQRSVPGHGYDIIGVGIRARTSFAACCASSAGSTSSPISPSTSPCRRTDASTVSSCARVFAGVTASRSGADDFAVDLCGDARAGRATAHLLDDVEARGRGRGTRSSSVWPSRVRTHPYLLRSFPSSRGRATRWRSSATDGAAGPLVGNGPFFVAEVADDRVLLAASPEWDGSRGNVAEVEVGFRAPREAGEDWRAGRYDFLLDGMSIRGDAPQTVELLVPVLGTSYLAFAGRKPFDDERVRRALAHGLDRARLTQDTPYRPALGGMIPPALPGHSHDLALPFDVDRARALLADAGYPDGRGLPELLLLHADTGFGEGFRREREARWQPQWRQLGVRLVRTGTSGRARAISAASPKPISSNGGGTRTIPTRTAFWARCWSTPDRRDARPSVSSHGPAHSAPVIRAPRALPPGRPAARRRASMAGADVLRLRVSRSSPVARGPRDQPGYDSLLSDIVVRTR